MPASRCCRRCSPSPSSKPIDGREFITCLVLGYEIATRAGMALHATARDYHTSGAWNALGCAAIGARMLGLSADATRHALGIAEYHGPRSQMMRCIDHPTMVKDGSGFGALAGVSAACLAADGFTGAPALLIEGEAEAPFWRDLGTAGRSRGSTSSPIRSAAGRSPRWMRPWR